MIALLTDLDDAGALAAANASGLLRGAALGGAQVRSTAEAVREDALVRLADLRPRSVVLVTGDGRAARAAAMLIAALGSKAGLPIVRLDATPPWVGPLDVVVFAGEDVGDPQLAESVELALGRGAEVVIATPDEGPMRAAAAGRAAKLPPRVPVPDANTLLRHLAVGIAVLEAVDPARSARLVPDLDDLARLLDAEATRNNPGSEIHGNPAKSLASRMHNHRLIFAGADQAGTELATHAAETLLRVAGVPAGATGLADATAAAAALAPTAAGIDPLFYDADFDGPTPQEAVRVFVLSTDPDLSGVRRRMAALADADLLSAESGPPELVPPVRGQNLAQLAVLVVRLEMAAAYLTLLAGPPAAPGTEG